MVLMAGVDLPLRAIREQIASAIDVIVHLNRLRDGTRRVVGVDEVVGMEGDTVTLSDIYRFDFHAGVNDDGIHQGTLQPTGIRPGFSERLLDSGIALSAEVLGATDLSKARRR
jgi:pilus assembly protein CpaF